jgi:hypothetical protein
MKARPCIVAAILAAAAAVTSPPPVNAGWDHPHGDSANTGFAKVVTAPAVRPTRIVPVGELSSGAGPVIAPNGTVYVGNLFGQVLAFHADGTPAWSAQLPPGQWVTASPVVDAGGFVYVVSETRRPDFNYESTLHKFTPGGGLVFEAPFPEHSTVIGAGRGDANAAPNIWLSKGQEAVLALALYYTEWHLIAFSTNGQVLGDIVVVQAVGGDITTVPFCDNYGWLRDLLCGGFRVPSEPFHCTDFSVCLPDDTDGPQPGVAVWQNPQGGTPIVVVSDGRLDTVGYTFDPASGFAESFRVHDTRRIAASAPVVLHDGHSAVGTTDPDATGRVTFAGPNFLQLADLGAGRLAPVDATPTRLADGRLVVIERTGIPGTQRKGRVSVLALLGNQSQSTEIRLDGESVASAAASCTYFYVASAGAFTTFDVRTLKPVAAVPWFGGGRSPPAIGPGGHVYAVASNAMFVFPPGQAVTFVGTACAPDEKGGG